MNRIQYLALIVLCLSAQPGELWAQPATTATQAATETPAQAVDMVADRLEYDADKNLLVGKGNVEVQYLGDILKADYLEVNTATDDAYARGNVYVNQQGTIWEGEELRYNMRTKQGDFGPFKAFSAPFYITARESSREGEDLVALEGVSVTTCEGPKPEYLITARSAMLVDGHLLKSRGVTFRLFSIPFFYLPIYNKDLNHSAWDFLPGYSSRHGAFLLTKYNYQIAPGVNGAVRLDVRSKRGLALGKDFNWRDVEEDRYRGEVNFYYADDQDPLQDETDELNYGDTVDNERYRLRLQHRQNFTPRDYLTANFNYLSDPLVLDDFFPEEFRRGSQPENRATFTHRDDYFTAGVDLSVRLNDFYSNVNRAPEFFLDVQRQQVYETDLYYESFNRAGFYQRVYAEDSDAEDYDALRADTSHAVYYPMRHFGWLNVIPRAGYRGTYYSETRSTTTTTNLIDVTDEVTGEISQTNQVSRLTMTGAADLRNVFSLGVESSFKAFRKFHDEPTIFGRGLRHVVEPFVNYTYVPEPNLRPSELPQFDATDQVDLSNYVLFGLRNKLQTRVPSSEARRSEVPGFMNEDDYSFVERGSQIRDLVNVELYTLYRLESLPGESDFGPLYLDGRLRPSDWMELNFDGEFQYDEETQWDVFNTELRLIGRDASSVGLEYRFEQDRRDVLALNTSLFPRARWSPGAYWRYDLEEGLLREQEYYVIHKGGCLSWGLGVRDQYQGEDRENDLTVWAQIWLTAVPQTRIDSGR